MSRRGWIIFLILQTVGELCLWTAHLILSAIGPALLLVGLVLLLPGWLISVIFFEKFFWMSPLTLTSLGILEVPVAVGINACVWLALLSLYRVVRRPNPKGRRLWQKESPRPRSGMKRRWAVVFPLAGVTLFSLIAYHSFTRGTLNWRNHRHYLYWSSVRLDTDPLNRHPKPEALMPCQNSDDDCMVFDPEYIWVNPGWPTRVLEVSALPAFAIGAILTACLARVGVSELVTFLIAMPILICAWFYLVGWLLDRYRHRPRREN